MVLHIPSLNFTKLSQFQLLQVIEMGWMERKEEKENILLLKLIMRTRLKKCTQPFVRNAEKSFTLKRGFRFPRKELDGLISLIFHLCFSTGKKPGEAAPGRPFMRWAAQKNEK